MSNIVDFNKEKSKIEARKSDEIKRKNNNDKVIRKIKRNSDKTQKIIWKYYIGILIVAAVFVIIFK